MGLLTCSTSSSRVQTFKLTYCSRALLARDGEDGDARQRGLGLLLIEERLLVVGEGFAGHACLVCVPARRKEALNGPQLFWWRGATGAARARRIDSEEALFRVSTTLNETFTGREQRIGLLLKGKLAR